MPFVVVCGKEEPQMGKLCEQNLGPLQIRMQRAGREGTTTIHRLSLWCSRKLLTTLDTAGARKEAPRMTEAERPAEPESKGEEAVSAYTPGTFQANLSE